VALASIIAANTGANLSERAMMMSRVRLAVVVVTAVVLGPRRLSDRPRSARGGLSPRARVLGMGRPSACALGLSGMGARIQRPSPPDRISGEARKHAPIDACSVCLPLHALSPKRRM
jgi:hypothetical protein